MRRKITLLIFIFHFSLGSFAQDLEKVGKDLKNLKDAPKNLLKDKSVKITGLINTNTVYFNAFDQPQPLKPFNYVINGSLNVDLFGKIKMPVNFSFSNQSFNYQHPFNQKFRFRQPFNRLVLKPTYKGFTLHSGTVSLNFSPFTLAGHRFNGVGLEYKPQKGPIYFGLMYGNLQKAVRVDTSQQVGNNLPSFQRKSMGAQLGYKKDQTQAEIILFNAYDRINSLPYNLDFLQISPQANTVGSFKFAQLFNKKLLLNTEIAVSGLSTDVRAGVGLRENTFTNTFGGLLSTNASTTYKKAIKALLNYKGKTFTSGLEYSRIDPGYRTLGGYFFNNDLETYATNIATQAMQGKLSIMANIGLQKDNLDGQKFQTTQRWVGATNLTFNPNEKTNITASYSNFSSYSNLRSVYDYLTQITPYNALDTLDYRQINQSVMFNLNQILPSKSENLNKNMALNLAYQMGSDQQGGQNIGTNILNATFNYGQINKTKKLTFSSAFNLSRNQLPNFNDLMWGPSLMVGKKYLDDALMLKTGLTYSNVISNGRHSVDLLNLNGGCTYTIQKKHNFNLMLIYMNRKASNLERIPVKSLSEFTATLGYSYSFSLLDTSKKVKY
jgi:hypothetical protein